MAARNQNQTPESETETKEVETQEEASKALPVLVSPDGERKWTPENRVQATNLRAQGWKPEEDKTTSKTSN